jgi:hypothetical protein
MARGKHNMKRHLSPQAKAMLTSGGKTAKYHREAGAKLTGEPIGRALKSGHNPAGRSSPGGKKGRR